MMSSYFSFSFLPSFVPSKFLSNLILPSFCSFSSFLLSFLSLFSFIYSSILTSSFLHYFFITSSLLTLLFFLLLLFSVFIIINSPFNHSFVNHDLSLLPPSILTSSFLTPNFHPNFCLTSLHLHLLLPNIFLFVINSSFLLLLSFINAFFFCFPSLTFSFLHS